MRRVDGCQIKGVLSESARNWRTIIANLPKLRTGCCSLMPKRILDNPEVLISYYHKMTAPKDRRMVEGTCPKPYQYSGNHEVDFLAI